MSVLFNEMFKREKAVYTHTHTHTHTHTQCDDVQLFTRSLFVVTLCVFIFCNNLIKLCKYFYQFFYLSYYHYLGINSSLISCKNIVLFISTQNTILSLINKLYVTEVFGYIKGFLLNKIYFSYLH